MVHEYYLNKAVLKDIEKLCFKVKPIKDLALAPDPHCGVKL